MIGFGSVRAWLPLAGLCLFSLGCGSADATGTPAAPVAPATIRIFSGNDQSGDAGTRLADSLTVEVDDASAKPMAGISVSWQVTLGGASVSPQTSITDSQGHAKTALTLGPVAGVDSGFTTISGSSIASAKFAATGSAGAVAVVSVTPSALTLFTGQTGALIAGFKDAFGNVVSGVPVAWASNAPAVATVSAGGVVTAVAPGAASIAAVAQGKSGSATVNVALVPVATVDILAPKTALASGDTVQLTAVPRDSAKNQLSGRIAAWTSGAPAVATVSATGLVTGVSIGSADISALVEGRTGRATIAVTSENLGVFSETSPTLRPDIDTYFGTFSGSGGSFSEFVQDASTKVEGTVSLRMTAQTSGSGFVGWFVAWGDSAHSGNDQFTRDMSKYAGGSLRVWVLSPVDLQVGIRSGNVPAGSETSKVVLSALGAAPNSLWKHVCVPIGLMTGSAPLADPSQTKILFTVAISPATGGTGGRSVSFWIDDVRWDTRPC